MAHESVSAFIALGANLGNAATSVRQAVASIAQLQGTQLGACSSLYQTAPIESGGPDYINAVLEIKTTLSAPELLLQLQNIEQQAGRQRPQPNAPRTLDLDILLYGSASINSPKLTVPHPRMWQRAFVLQPLHEVAPLLVSAAQLRSVSMQAIEKLL